MQPEHLASTDHTDIQNKHFPGKEENAIVTPAPNWAGLWRNVSYKLQAKQQAENAEGRTQKVNKQ